MRKNIAKQVLAILAAMLILTSAVSAAVVGQDPIGKDKKEKKAEVDPDNFIVQYKDKKNHDLVKRPDGKTLEEAMKEYQKNPRVKYVEFNEILHIMNTPNDPGLSSLWAMNNTGQTGGTPGIDIGALRAWDLTTGSSNVVVAVIDTGVDYNHPDLAANIWTNPGEIAGNGIDDDGNGFVDDVHGIDTYNNDADPMDDHNHGTHVSGTICAEGNNGIGVVGVNWYCKIMAVKFLGAGGSGTTDGAIKAIRYAKLMGAKIMSNSWGGGGYSQALADEINDAIVNYGVIFVAAAGNSGSNNDVTPAYPANYPGVIAVAAIDHNGNLAPWSSYGVNKVRLAASGVNIYSTVRNGGYATYSGTSMATPHVAGAVALIWSLYSAATREQVEARLLGGIMPLASLAGKVKTGGIVYLPNSLETDIIAPSAITDLGTSDVTSESIRVKWTAPGDDGVIGSASSYDLRYSLAPITEANWANAVQATEEPAPQPVGSEEAFVVTGLEPGTTYYFAIKSRDNVGNPSEISNVVSATTIVQFIVFSDDMENGINGWTHSGISDSWILGTPIWVVPHSGTNAWSSGYSNGMNARLVSRSFSLGNIINSRLSVWHNYNTEDRWDGSIDIISINNGPWTQITPIDGYPGVLYSYNPLGAVPAFTGNSGGWKKIVYDLSAYDGETDVRFSSAFATDGSIIYYGRVIDNVDVYGTQTETPPNQPPTADNLNVIVEEDNSIDVILTGSDPDNSILTHEIVSSPPTGTITPDPAFTYNGKITYMPCPNCNGLVSFSHRVFDGLSYSEPGIAQITINPVNDRPVANSQSITLNEDTTVIFVPTGADIEQNPLTFSIAVNPINGVMTLGSSGWIYTPNLDFNGIDTIQYVANDSELTSEPAIVTFTVNPMPEKCWDGANRYLVNNKDQARKFAKCASGIYEYPVMVTEKGGTKYTAYRYADINNTENWSIELIKSANRPVKAVLVNGRPFPTNQTYFR